MVEAFRAGAEAVGHQVDVADVYEGAMFSYQGDFLDYLGLEDMGVFTVHTCNGILQGFGKLPLVLYGHSCQF